MIKSEVTLLLTIYNRRTFTLRWIQFIKDFNCPFNIYICDGGNDKLIERKLKNLAKNNSKIKYKKFTFYKNYQKFHEKFYLATKDIKTKYTYLCEDDDFVIFENIKKSEYFLNKNNDYTCSGGQSFNVEILQNNLFFARTEHKKNISYKDNSKYKRILKVLNNMQSNYNCLHRTLDLNKVFKMIHKIDFKNIYETELLFVMASLYFGKVNRFNHIEYVKIDNTEFSSSSIFSTQYGYLDIVTSPNYSLENYAFVHFFKKEFFNSQMNTIKKNINNFLININKDRFDEIYLSNKQRFINIIRKIIKNSLLSLHLFSSVKKFYIRLFFIKTKNIDLYNKSRFVNSLSEKQIIFFTNLLKFLSKS